MKRTSLILSLIVAILSTGCMRSKNSRQLPATQAMQDILTCVAIDPTDSTTLLLGCRGARFARYHISDGFTEYYPLPDSTRGWNSYDILPLSAREFLVAKSNHGVLYVRYGIDSMGWRAIEHISYVTSPNPLGPPPHKGTRYSTYSLTHADSIIVLGTTNGLMYLAKDSIAKLSKADTVYACNVKPLVRLRDEQFQFLQETVLYDGDSVTTATDRGLYRIALHDFDKDTLYNCIGGQRRCRSATLTSSSLMVIYSPAHDSKSRRLATIARHGRQICDSTDVDPGTTWIGHYGDTVRHFGSEDGDFATQRTAVNAGGRFWFIRDGQLHYTDPTTPTDGTHENIIFSDNRYGVSNHNGLWRLDGDKATFLGTLRGVSGIKDISTNSTYIYLVGTNGVYRASLTSYIFPADRDATLIDAIETGTDRAESVLATDSIVLVGTREGLHSLDPTTGQRRQSYNFAKLANAYENPYICDIQVTNGGEYVMQTLNHGVWHLKSTDDIYARPSNNILRLTDAPPPDWPTLERPALTWRAIGQHTLLIIIGILCIIGLFYVIISAIRYRHKLEMSAANEKIKRLDDAEKNLAKLRTEKDEALKLDSKTSGRELTSLAKNIKDVIKNLNENTHAHRYLTEALADIMEYLNNDRPDTDQMEKAEAARRNVDDYSRFRAERLYELAKFQPDAGPFVQPMSVFSKKVIQKKDVSLQPLKSRLEWIVESEPILDELLNSCKKLLDAEISNCRPVYRQTKDKSADPVFKVEELRTLWEGCIQPFIGRSTKLKISEKPFEKTPPEDNAVKIAVLTFYGLRKCIVKGKNFERTYTCERQHTRFDKTDNIGSFYRRWAEQLTDSCFKYGPDTVPGNPAELLWHVCLSQLPFNVLDNRDENKVTLSHGIRLAFHVTHGLKIPEDIEHLRNNRILGRPIKRE